MREQLKDFAGGCIGVLLIFGMFAAFVWVAHLVWTHAA